MVGKKFGNYIVLKQSSDMFECSNGEQVIRLSEEDIRAGNFNNGSLMYNIAPEPVKEIKAKRKKTATKKKK